LLPLSKAAASCRTPKAPCGRKKLYGIRRDDGIPWTYF
jgi:hypothetical protein